MLLNDTFYRILSRSIVDREKRTRPSSPLQYGVVRNAHHGVAIPLSTARSHNLPRWQRHQASFAFGSGSQGHQGEYEVLLEMRAEEISVDSDLIIAFLIF